MSTARAAGSGVRVRPHQREQRQDAALAAVVGAQDERDVLEGDHEVQRPEHERQHAEHVLARGREPVVPG